MNVDVQLFARARDLAGTDRISVALPEGATVADLRAALVSSSADLAPLVPSLHVAIDHEYADDATPVPAGAEVACFPPVSGG